MDISPNTANLSYKPFMKSEFKSIFADNFRELIAVKRIPGFKYLSEEGTFPG